MASSDYDSLSSIIEGCYRGDERAQERLYKRYFGYAMSVALLYSNNRNDAIEVVNDSFIKIFKEIKRYNPSLSFKGWLRKIVINSSLDKIRREKRVRESVGQEHLLEFESTGKSSLEEIAEKEILSLINQLPHIYRTVFMLFEIEGYNHREIAKRLKIAQSSSRVYLTRAKEQLRVLYRQRVKE